MLIARATSRQVSTHHLYKIIITGSHVYPQAITVLNNAGVCVSYVSAWRRLVVGVQYLEVIRTGHWIWITTRSET